MPKVVLEFEIKQTGEAVIREMGRTLDSAKGSFDAMAGAASAAGEMVERSAKGIAGAVAAIAEAPAATARAIHEVASAGRDFADSASTVAKTASLVYTGYKIGLPVLGAASAAYRGIQAGALLATDATMLLVNATQAGIAAAFTPLGSALIIATAAQRIYGGVLDSVAHSQAEVNLQVDRTDYAAAAQKYAELAIAVETFRIRGTLGFSDFSQSVQGDAASAYDSMGRFMSGVADWLGRQLPGELGTGLQTWRNYYREIDMAAKASLFEQASATKVALLEQEAIIAAATQQVQLATKNRGLSQTIPERQQATAELRDALADQVEAERDHLQIIIEQLNKDVQNPQKIADEPVNRQKLFNAIELRRGLLDIGAETNQQLAQEDARFTSEILRRRTNAMEEAEVAIAQLRIATAENAETEILAKREAATAAALRQYDKDYAAFGQTEDGKRVAAERLMVGVEGIEAETAKKIEQIRRQRSEREIAISRAALEIEMHDAVYYTTLTAGQIAAIKAQEASKEADARFDFAQKALEWNREVSDAGELAELHLVTVVKQTEEDKRQERAKSFLDTRRNYDDEVQRFINAELEKTGYFINRTRIQRDKEVGLFQAQEQLRLLDLKGWADYYGMVAAQDGDWWAAMQAGALDTLGQLGTFWGDVRKGFGETFRDSQRLASDLFFDVFTGDLHKLGDEFANFGKRMLRTIADILADAALRELLGLLIGSGNAGGLGTGGGITLGVSGQGSGGGGTSPVGLANTGLSGIQNLTGAGGSGATGILAALYEKAFGATATTQAFQSGGIIGGINSLLSGETAGAATTIPSLTSAEGALSISAPEILTPLSGMEFAGGSAGAAAGADAAIGAGAEGAAEGGAMAGMEGLGGLSAYAPPVAIAAFIIQGWVKALSHFGDDESRDLSTRQYGALVRAWQAEGFPESGANVEGLSILYGRSKWAHTYRPGDSIEMPWETWSAYPPEVLGRMDQVAQGVEAQHYADITGPRMGEARKAGGPVWPGSPFLVGEAGPELFVPGQSGMVMNTRQTSEALGGGGDTVVIHNYITIENRGILHGSEIPERVVRGLDEALQRYWSRRRKI